MKKTNEKKLTLDRNTIAVLTRRDLLAPAGGRIPITRSCAAECGGTGDCF